MFFRFKAADISIHVPREGDDCRCHTARSKAKNYFYPRPPRGGRPTRDPVRSLPQAFLSTSPARGTTTAGSRSRLPAPISIHVPREGDDFAPSSLVNGRGIISIHVPREGDDEQYSGYEGLSLLISIHVPREGDDMGRHGQQTAHNNFYPRPPRGGRLCDVTISRQKKDFYPRPPRGGRPNP